MFKKIKNIVKLALFAKNRTMIYLGSSKALTKTVFGQKMIVNTEDLSLSPHILLDGYWEWWITQVFRKSIKPGMVVVDIGSNIGYYSVMAAALVGNTGKVYAFEANSELVDIIISNMDINGFIDYATICNKAVYSTSKTLSFNKMKNHKGSSSVNSFSKELLEKYNDDIETVNVEAVSLDDFFKTDSEHVDLIKIDAEGSEYHIWRGMQRIVSHNQKIAIIMEFTLCFVQASTDPMTFLKEIESQGFILRIISQYGNTKIVTKEELLSMDSAELYLSREK